jgi:hypothetical protein
MKIQNLIKTGFLAGLIAVLLNVTVFFISTFIGSISKNVLLPGGNPLSIAPVVMSIFLSGLVASLVLFALSKFTKNSIKIFSIIGFVFLVVSMAGPFGTPNLPTGMRITLALMHLIAGSVIIYFLTKKSNRTNEI